MSSMVAYYGFIINLFNMRLSPNVFNGCKIFREKDKVVWRTPSARQLFIWSKRSTFSAVHGQSPFLS